jgi:FkbM family methyltransferase
MSTFLPSLKKSGHLDRVHMTVCIVGSRKIYDEDDYANQGWGIFAPHLSIYGFDADADACEADNADLKRRQINWTERHIPLALGQSAGVSTLYVTQSPMCSSLYAPNEPYLARFMNLPELVNLDFTLDLETTTLEQFCQQEGIDVVDFLKIDVQGADLQVLKGATSLVEKTVLGVQIEVEFSPLYVDQPLFADIDTFLRARDFTLFDIARSHCIRRHSPLSSTVHPGQLLWGDAFYFCDLIQDQKMTHAKTPEQIFKLACMADCMSFPDYALELLVHLTATYGSNSQYNFADNIVEVLSQFPALVQEGIHRLPIMARIQEYVTQPLAGI